VPAAHQSLGHSRLGYAGELTADSPLFLQRVRTTDLDGRGASPRDDFAVKPGPDLMFEWTLEQVRNRVVEGNGATARHGTAIFSVVNGLVMAPIAATRIP